MNNAAHKKMRASKARLKREYPLATARESTWFGFSMGYKRGYEQARRDARDAFDKCIDCLFEYDLAEALAEEWPADVRRSIEASRKRILRRYKRLMKTPRP